MPQGWLNLAELGSESASDTPGTNHESEAARKKIGNLTQKCKTQLKTGPTLDQQAANSAAEKILKYL